MNFRTSSGQNFSVGVCGGISAGVSANLRSRVTNFSKVIADRRSAGSRSVRLDRAKSELRKLFHRAKNQPTM